MGLKQKFCEIRFLGYREDRPVDGPVNKAENNPELPLSMSSEIGHLYLQFHSSVIYARVIL